MFDVGVEPVVSWDWCLSPWSLSSILLMIPMVAVMVFCCEARLSGDSLAV